MLQPPLLYRDARGAESGEWGQEKIVEFRQGECQLSLQVATRGEKERRKNIRIIADSAA
jgi:hypothetical protein